MFTGIVSELGTVIASTETGTGRRIVIDAPDSTADMEIGDSLAVNGVCLTAVSLEGSAVTIEAVAETLDRSNIGALAPGHRVDLERPLPASGRFDGHIVQGHVDGVGTVSIRKPEGDAERIRIEVPEGLSSSLVEKGSITVDGVSLTVTAVSPVAGDGAWFEIVLIPHTLDVTVLGLRAVGDRVNLEVDVIAKYIARHLDHTYAAAEHLSGQSAGTARQIMETEHAESGATGAAHVPTGTELGNGRRTDV